MKIAAISDIHGNIAALDAVLRDIAKHSIDQIVNLGDICSGSLFPRETADRLIPLEFPTIRGNHERQVLTLPLDRMGPSDRYAAQTLTPAQLAWFDSLPQTIRLNEDILLVHGTPNSDLDYLLETVTPEGLRRATQAEIKDRAGNCDARVILCGHTHLARVERLHDGRLIVNPGSVGLPAYTDDHPYPHSVEAGSPQARYAIVSDNGGDWSAEIHCVDYDWEQAACVALSNGRQEWAIALRTGRN
ncbi:metallophosphoesterase family protein [Novosphingobium terrae]|uniref:metallophosphoesterase family protein n=1 Tax=Novosphingobium terrae TaxID=2726189 RepID=UPI00197FB2FC|nr:metallophosphoesterase family protein [Novosphingobium terrae]